MYDYADYDFLLETQLGFCEQLWAGSPIQSNENFRAHLAIQGHLHVIGHAEFTCRKLTLDANNLNEALDFC